MSSTEQIFEFYQTQTTLADQVVEREAVLVIERHNEQVVESEEATASEVIRVFGRIGPRLL
jgi:hypothetical protein